MSRALNYRGEIDLGLIEIVKTKDEKEKMGSFNLGE